MTDWPKVWLGEVLTPANREETVDALKEYRLLGVRLNGQGPFLRETVTGAQIAATKLYRVTKGDFIYSRLFACRGAFGVIGDELDGCYVSGEFPNFVPEPERVDVEFLRYWFRLPPVIARVDEDCTGSTPLTRNRFKEHFFLALEIPLPPLTEQQRIVARIEEMAAQIQEARSLRRQAVEEAGAITLTAVTSLCFQNHPTRPFGEYLLEAKNGIYKPPVFWGQGLPCIRMYNINGPELNQNNLQLLDVSPEEFDVYGCTPGDLVFNRVNSAELVGKTGLVRSDFPKTTFESKNMRLRVDRSLALPEFAALVLNSLPVRNYYRQVLKQQCGMATLNQGHVRNIPFPAVPLPDQYRIVAELDALQAEVDALKRLQAETTAELDALLPAILDKAFKGEL